MRIAFLGDIAPLGSFDISNFNKVNWEQLRIIADYLATFDYVIGNLECPFSRAKKVSGAKSAYLCCNIDNIHLLTFLHITHLNIANNHIFDFGVEGYETTKEILDDNNIEWFGAEGKTAKIENKVNSLILDGFCCYSTNPRKCVKYGTYGINEFDVDTVKSRLAEYKKKQYFPIISIHTGTEHVNYPDINNIKIARDFAEITPYIYYGHHPHVLQGFEFYKNSLIAHSLGNFIFDDIINQDGKCQLELTQNNRTSCILDVEIDNNIIISYKIKSIKIAKGTINFVDQPVISPESVSYLKQEFDKQPARYQAKRQAMIDCWTLERKAQRNISWYIKHLRWRYFLLLFTNKLNYYKYKIHFLNKVRAISNRY